ncbi:uncharacterized protein OCT59_017960 [Rhizophagus irregularis]|uniref:Aminodeoxychorismate lyase ABZ2 n=3 Tax=Rhizophagus irregularis TaxID=588596 RepID=A0A015JG90_RHIIW|nr:aminotransferase [Rhizophagus irregularis DAOM 181602=DAOM 197198]EXX53969.1 aminodeoxychorismate lyase ABZ2 [Rhizophagus irregularis DAOM 197198w]POG80051.1 aminotransferase [Rhizophagus irregularis DAOM 181602=DAOM 197198]UZO25698.1 hypothetical protein OCT59_017960 [Rhizophagus irregularis]GBC41530.1 aminodeoxychorismate synthase component I [Rhizophagus irregularis DAOM 181602=DAOM 197198]|eukprot:XP_025186917.1 aminotransferase [Rhizophagus irregularis DAOM 181602=DAOM 197198]
MDDINFQLLETILYEPQFGFYLLNLHLNRLTQSASYFSKQFNDKSSFANCTTSEFQEFIKEQLQESVSQIGYDKTQRVRLTVNKQGIPTITTTILPSSNSPLQEPLKITLDTQQTQSSDIFLYHKTTHRNIYNDARIRVGIESNKDLFDVLLYNERNEITECSIANIAVEYYDDEKNIKYWKTPKIECGLLGGVMRSHLIENGEIIPGVITLSEIKLAQQQGRKIKCFNSVRKEYDVILI